jgi:hypothetical protein
VWRRALAAAGVGVDAVDADHVRLWDDHGEAVVLVRRLPYRITPSKVPDPPAEPGLLVLPKASSRTMTAATDRGWFVATDSGAVVLTLGDRRIVRPPDEADAQTQHRQRPGPRSWVTFTVVRRLLAAPAPSQAELAHRLGVSQSKVSKVLNRLMVLGLVQRSEREWGSANWEGLVDWWLREYPGPGGTTSYWYSLDDLPTQTAAAVTILERAHGDARPVISGDAAADLLAPWRRPTRAVLYTQAAASLSPAGFVPVDRIEDATLVVTAAADPGVWLPRQWRVPVGDQHLPVADPLQVLFDVSHSEAPDAGEAADHLKAQLRGPLAESWRAAVAAEDVEGADRA